jgi:hypothetical protein
MIVQDNKVLPSYWGTGINGDDERIMKIMVRTKKNGALINGGKVRMLAKEFQDKYAEFDVTLGLANSTAALFTEDDINNNTAAATVEAWTTITNVEGFQELDIDGTGASGQEFYSKWSIGSQSVNDVYERTKWISQRAFITDENNAETGDDFPVDNGTITGIGTEFTARDNAQKLQECRFWLKRTGDANKPTGNMYCELYLSDDASPGEPTGAVLATSETLDTNRLTTSYVETIFRFNDSVTLTANEKYFIVIQHPDGTATNYVSADGDSTSADDGNYAYYQTAAWNGVTGDALRFEVKSSPIIHTMAGELFRGITHEIVFDTGGTLQENEIVVWGTDINFDTQTGSFTEGMYVIFEDAGTQVNSGKIVYTNDSTTMRVMLENITGSTLADGYDIKDADAPTTNYAKINTTITNQNRGGGEAILLALDDNTGTGELYIQLLSGVAPVDDLPIRGLTSTNSVTVNATVNSYTIKPEFLGQSTGVNIIGNYGIGFTPADVGSSDKFTDLGGTPRTPPNNVQFVVAGLVSGEDYVLVAPRSGSTMNKALYTLNGAHNSPTQTTITVNEAIQTETPPNSTGNSAIRVQMDTGIYRYQQYNSWSGSVFNITSADYSGGNAAGDGNDVFPSYIDVLCNASTESFTAVHATTRDILIRVRDGGDTGGTPIKTVSSSAQFTGSPQTVTINRVNDY